ncbi:MAG TPA: rhomboid family intramembrane serine protease [Verrucomicrobiae bacterium]|nr:rhomboid family intramembrane serine protease [Verrucomicrobiae bacterium]
MLEDRDYMRQPVYREPRISFTIAVLIVNALAFVIECIFCGYPPAFSKDNYFALSLRGIEHGYVWQLLTFQFMHGGLIHILFNSVAIFFFGRPVENFFGRAKFLALYLASGVIGGLVQVLVTFFLPGFFADVPVVGASAGAYGLVAAFAVLYWQERFTLFLYFIPVAMRGKTLLWVSLALAAAGMLIPNSNIADAAHVGGILAGFLCAHLMLRGNWPQWRFPSRRSAQHEFAAAGKSKGGFWHSSAAKPDEDLSAEEFLQKQVDPILEKISAHGIQSLTAHEREILEKARSKMNQR